MALDEISASLVRDSVELFAERGPSRGFRGAMAGRGP
jgi:hypothetical protein